MGTAGGISMGTAGSISMDSAGGIGMGTPKVSCNDSVGCVSGTSMVEDCLSF